MGREPKFLGTITYSRRPIAGVTLYSDRKPEPTIEEMLDELDKSDIQEARKEVLLRKLRERGGLALKQGEAYAQPNPKRYLVDPETGRVSVDEEEGEYTYKDVLLVSASIKGKSGQYDDAISLINAAKTLAQDSRAKVTEKPKEYYVEPDTGIIVHDPDNGEYTLSEARAVSQSLQKVTKPGGDQPPPGFLIDEGGNLKQLQPGEPVVIKRVIQQPGKTYIVDAKGELQEQEPGKPLVIKVEAPGGGAGMPSMVPFPVFGSDGQPVYDKDGKPVFANIDPMMKWMGFQSEQRRADERHGAVMGLVQTARENLSDGIAAIKAAAEEAKKGTGSKTVASEQPTVYECSNCHTQFQIPDVPFETVKCPNPKCGRIYTKEEVMAA